MCLVFVSSSVSCCFPKKETSEVRHFTMDVAEIFVFVPHQASPANYHLKKNRVIKSVDQESRNCFLFSMSKQPSAYLSVVAQAKERHEVLPVRRPAVQEMVGAHITALRWQEVFPV